MVSLNIILYNFLVEPVKNVDNGRICSSTCDVKSMHREILLQRVCPYLYTVVYFRQINASYLSINFVNEIVNYVNMQDKTVNMQNDYADMQRKCNQMIREK